MPITAKVKIIRSESWHSRLAIAIAKTKEKQVTTQTIASLLHFCFGPMYKKIVSYFLVSIKKIINLPIFNA